MSGQKRRSPALAGPGSAESRIDVTSQHKDCSPGRILLAGWRFEPKPRRTLARLKLPDGATELIPLPLLIAAPEYMGGLSQADRDEVREMAMQGAA